MLLSHCVNLPNVDYGVARVQTKSWVTGAMYVAICGQLVVIPSFTMCASIASQLVVVILMCVVFVLWGGR